jgi:xylan 1,4-beta-xylosidase
MPSFAACPLIYSLSILLPFTSYAQSTVTIRIDAAEQGPPLSSSWAYFGYDEPNFTYGKDGTKLIDELAAASRVPVRIRTHNILTTGDGTPGLKFGSTNAYTQDASGKPVYDWTIVDRIFETYLKAGAKPLVEIGFMPKALSTNPEPYAPVFHNPSDFKHYYLGWSYPPKDYAKWGELVYQFVTHAVTKYGQAEVETWDWEVWNEPDGQYWHGTPEDYDKLYDYSAAGAKRALPTVRIGGPATTSPRNAKAAEYLRQFLAHCATGKNYVTGKTGSPLDFISFHAKGKPDVEAGHVRMGIAAELKDASQGFTIVRSFPKFERLPVILTEADPEGCAACSSRDNPANAYRNGTLYPAYTAAALKGLAEIAEREHINLQGIITWAFEFEGQPYFAGYRDLATNGIDKPVLNIFRMSGLMCGNEVRGNQIRVESDGAESLDAMISKGVRDKALVDARGARFEHGVSLLVWHYQDDNTSGPAATVHLQFTGLPASAHRLLLHHYRIDNEHSNAYTLWQKLGNPEHPSEAEYRELEAAGQLQTLSSPRWIDARSGGAELEFSLPLQAISLVELGW